MNPIPRIVSASVQGKKLFVFGENFDPGAVILRNGEEQKTKNDDLNPQTALIGKKAGKRIKPGDKLQVRNPQPHTLCGVHFHRCIVQSHKWGNPAGGDKCEACHLCSLAYQ